MNINLRIKTFFQCILIWVCFNASAQQNIEHEWIGLSANATFVASDNDEQNNVIVCGYNSEQVDLDFSTTVHLSGQIGIYDQTFIAKYDADKELKWVADLVPNTQMAYAGIRVFDIVIDANGDIVCTGEFVGIVDVDPGVDTFYLESSYGSNTFILKLSANGDLLWAKVLQGKMLSTGSPSYSSSSANSLSTDAFSNIIIGGKFQGNVDFDPGNAEYLQESSTNGTYGGYVLKLDQNGQFLWQRSYNSYYQDAITNVVVGPGNQIYIGGYFYDSLHVSSIYLDTLMQSFFTPAYFLFNAKLDPQGQEQWVTRMTIHSASMNRMRVDAEGNLLVGGFFNTYLGINDGTAPHHFYPCSDTISGQWGSDGFILKYSSSGNFEWCHTIGTPSVDNVFDFDLLENGDILLGTYLGNFMSPMDVCMDGTYLFSLGKEYTSYIKLKASGEYRNHTELAYEGKRINAMVNASVLVLGKVSINPLFPIDFDPNPNQEFFTTSATSSISGFVHKLSTIDVDASSGSIVLGPNPTTSTVTVFLKEHLNDSKLTLVSITGEILIEIAEPSSIETLDLSSFAQGIYFVRVAGTGFNAVEKLMKN